MVSPTETKLLGTYKVVLLSKLKHFIFNSLVYNFANRQRANRTIEGWSVGRFMRNLWGKEFPKDLLIIPQ